MLGSSGSDIWLSRSGLDIGLGCMGGDTGRYSMLEYWQLYWLYRMEDMGALGRGNGFSYTGNWMGAPRGINWDAEGNMIAGLLADNVEVVGKLYKAKE